MKLRVRLLILRFLRRFSEYRSLVAAEAQHKVVMGDAYREIAKLKRELGEAQAKLLELSAGLATMTEARLNSDRHSEALQRTVTALSLSHESSINSLKQTVDCFSLASMGRQVFGMAPSVTRQIDEMAQQPIQAGIQARKMVQEQTQAAYQEAIARRDAFLQQSAAIMEQMKQGSAPPDAQAEYSSTAHAYSGPLGQ